MKHAYFNFSLCFRFISFTFALSLLSNRQMAKFGPVDAQQQQQQQQGSNHATYIDIPNIDGKASVEQQVEIHGMA